MLRYKHLVVNKTYTQTVNANTGYRTGGFELTINLEVVHPDHLVVGQANGEAYHEMLTLIDQIVEVVLPNQTVARIGSPISIGGSFVGVHIGYIKGLGIMTVGRLITKGVPTGTTVQRVLKGKTTTVAPGT